MAPPLAPVKTGQRKKFGLPRRAGASSFKRVFWELRKDKAESGCQRERILARD